MIVELLRVQCGCGNQLAGLFDNHHAAIVAGERAGWLMQSESIGGDLCPRCLGREEPAEGGSPIRATGILLTTMKERDAARAQVAELRMRLAEANDTLRPVMDANEDLREHVNLLKRERDEARAEAEHWRAMADVASPVLGDGPFPSLPWDTNDNGAIDDADELAAYAEASDLRALAEREAVTEGGGDE